MLCARCYKNITQGKEVKLKDNSIVCNKCAERIQKEYHKERYKKYLNGEISYDELDPEGGRPINIEFLEILCSHCFKSLAENSEKASFKSSAIAYDKCKGRKCPDCGKTRHLDRIEIDVFKDGFAGFMCICPRCQKEVGYKLNGVCLDCFWEREEERGCVCIGNKFNSNPSRKYYCFICEDVHASFEFLCGNCDKLIESGSAVPIGKKLIRP